MKLISRLKPWLSRHEISTALTPSQDAIEFFETAFAGAFDCRYGLMFSYGRSGLRALLKAWQLERAEIICPAYTCVVVPHAIVLSGNIPVFVDCEPGSFNMSQKGIKQAITPTTRAVIATHLFGYPMDIEQLETIIAEAELKYRHKIFVIQDCAHSFGAKWNEKSVTAAGDAALFGLNISKMITSVFGGMITTNNKETYYRLRCYRDRNFIRPGLKKSLSRLLYLLAVYPAFNPYVYALVNRLERNGFLDRFTRYYDPAIIEFPTDWNHLPTELEARVGLVQLEKYEEIIEARRKTAAAYREALHGLPGVTIPPHTDGCTYSHFPLLVDDRDRWIKAWRQGGIQLGTVIDYSVPELEAYADYRQGEYPVSRDYTKRIINIPVWRGAQEKCLRQIERMKTALSKKAHGS